MITIINKYCAICLTLCWFVLRSLSEICCGHFKVDYTKIDESKGDIRLQSIFMTSQGQDKATKRKFFYNQKVTRGWFETPDNLQLYLKVMH